MPKNCRKCGIELNETNWYPSYKEQYNNICIECEKERQKKPEYKEVSKLRYQDHKEEHSKYNKQYRIEHKEEISKNNKEWYQSNKEEISEKNRIEYQKLRHEVLYHYSNGTMKCMCPGCGENHLDFLSLDHINNDGYKHRKEIGLGGTRLLRWIVKNNFPKGFRVLCMNCNFPKGKNGYCSKHQTK